MLPRTLSLAIDKARLRRAAPHVASGFRQVESGCEVAAEQAVERRGGISDPTDCDGPARWAGAAVVIRRDHQEVVTRIKLVEFDARGATRAACFFRGNAERVRIARSLQKKAAASSPASIDCTCSLPFGYGRCTLMTRAGPVRGTAPLQTTGRFVSPSQVSITMGSPIRGIGVLQVCASAGSANGRPMAVRIATRRIHGLSDMTHLAKGRKGRVIGIRTPCRSHP